VKIITTTQNPLSNQDFSKAAAEIATHLIGIRLDGDLSDVLHYKF